MRLACTLLDHGYVLKKPPAAGAPDVLCPLDGRMIRFEAMSVKQGSGADQAGPDETHQGMFCVEHDKHIVRYAAALPEKRKQCRGFLDRQAVEHSDSIVVAINASANSVADIERGIPNIVRAVFPIDTRQWQVPINTRPGHIDAALPSRDTPAEREIRASFAPPAPTCSRKRSPRPTQPTGRRPAVSSFTTCGPVIGPRL
jgi:hypothetical protein